MNMKCIIALLTLVSAILPVVCAEPPAAPRPNIVLIVTDTVRKDHLGCYGYARDTSPNIDALARKGLRFEKAVATSSWTIPSLMSMFTGLPPSLHQATSYDRKLAPGIHTLASVLKDAGYQTVGITSNPSAGRQFGFSKGFDVYDDYTVSLANMDNLLGDSKKQKNVRNMNTSPIVNRTAFNWLETKRSKDAPFFLFVLYIDPHGDYAPPEPYASMFNKDYSGTTVGNIYDDRKREYSAEDRKQIISLYDGEIRFTDEHIGALLRKLDELKLTNDTLIVFTADHGEEFWDHGGILHGHSLYDELVRVPLIYSWPERIKPGTVIDGWQSTQSIMATLLEAANCKIPDQNQSSSTWNAIIGKADPITTEVFSETEAEEKSLNAIYGKDGKLIVDLKTGRTLAFASNDLLEAENVFAKDPAWVKQLSTRYDEWRKSIDQKRQGMEKADKAEMDEKLLEQLRQMGYAQ
jgi:arylsulfatase A-like enzyme